MYIYLTSQINGAIYAETQVKEKDVIKSDDSASGTEEVESEEIGDP